MLIKLLARLLVTIGIVFYAVVVPIFEINASHVFNPGWEAHARLHEVWQLATNCALGAFSLWLVWWRGEIRLSSLLTLFVTGGFLLAYGLRDSYGGSMVLSDGSEKLILGINLGLFAYSLAIALAAIAVLLDRAQGKVTLEGAKVAQQWLSAIETLGRGDQQRLVGPA